VPVNPSVVVILVRSYFLVEGDVPYGFNSVLLIHQIRYCTPHNAVVAQWVCWIFDVDILILPIVFCQLKELNAPEDDNRTSFKSNVFYSEQDRVQTLSDPHSS
jgi:hypothetical protein